MVSRTVTSCYGVCGDCQYLIAGVCTNRGYDRILRRNRTMRDNACSHIAKSETSFKCPFCDIELDRKQMRYHVGIPLCIELRRLNVPSDYIPHPMESFRVPATKLELEYFGVRGLKKLIVYGFQRMTIGHPDEGKICELEKFVDHSEDKRAKKRR